MRRVRRIVLLAILAALAPVLAGCEDFDMKKFDIFHLNDKPKLPGERKELFPGGVPGVTQGIPPEYLKGNQPPSTAQALAPDVAAAANPGDKTVAPAQPSKTAAVVPTAEPKLKAKRKRKRKPRVVAHRPTQVTVRPVAKKKDGGQQKPAPWPARNKAQSAWPAQGKNTSMEPWPTAPPPGTFSH
jgi:hypothetical protein